MDCWWNNIQVPITLKATLEFLSATRTTLELRNEICHQLMQMTNEKECGHNSSRICAVNELFDCATELRTRIIGPCDSAKYGAYEALHHCCLKLHVCQGTYVVECDKSRGCSYTYYDDEESSPVCALNIQACAKKIVCVLLEVLPKFYITLIAILARLWNDGTWYKLYINKGGPLCDALTRNGKIHECAECPYAKVQQPAVGLNKVDIKGTDPGDKIEAVMLKLVGERGCLRTIIDMMKSSDGASEWSTNYSSIGTLDKVSSWYTCTCVKRDDNADIIKRTPRKPKPRCTPRRVPCRNRRRRNAENGGSNTNASATTGDDKVEGYSPTTSAAVETVASSDISSAVNTAQSTNADIGNRVSTIATTLRNDSAATNVTNRDMANKYLFMNPYYVTGSYQKNNYKWEYDSRTSMYSEAPSQPTIYNITAAQSTQSNSSCAASGVAAGCLLVGCVGVGAAYGFNLGGFKTLVNSLF
ncbi:Ig-like domain-containing protein [Babesia caballi]|uniref:Ig-like domain-containing protein n=1 Tax=Babesia caballi TaxID=5871 RepID=A0AAV4M1X1_BABCB|nr:Ig-like domain-containing protein [Babesia caballi]